MIFFRRMILAFLAFLCLSTSVFATKLIEVRPVDHQYIMIHFRDGEVLFRDDATGPSAYTGHDFSEGDDKMLEYGDDLDVTYASLTKSWKILSTEDLNYGSKGLMPVSVHRKSKIMNSDAHWNYEFDHWIFLKLPEPLKQGVEYNLKISGKTKSDQKKVIFTFDVFSHLSEAVHVNMIGYVPESPVKSADLYLWLGDGGQRDYSDFSGNKVWLKDVNNGEVHEVGEVKFWKKSSKEYRGWNLTGSDVWNVDFNDFTKPGSYKLVVENVGSSREFTISNEAYFEPYKTSVRGYYYMRIGEDQMDMIPVPRRPLFIPGKDPEDFTIYLTDLHPFLPIWDSIPGDTWDEPHFRPAKESIFWKHRLPGNPINKIAKGGHSDALDWDRHLAHVSNIYDLLLPYYLSSGNLDEDNLDIAESGNGIPDIIDEARNEVDFFLSIRDGEAYCQGLTNPSKEKNAMFQAGATTMAAWANAANCAMLAECLKMAAKETLSNYYLKEAITAFHFAEKQEDMQLDDRQDIGDSKMRGRDFRMMAAAFIYNLTGERQWEEIMAADSEARNGMVAIDNRNKWVQIWGTAAYLNSEQEIHFPELRSNMLVSVKNQAINDISNHMYERPSRKSNNRGNWRTPQNLQVVLLAHAFCNDQELKDELATSMLLEADWGLGRNPSNMVEMTGLGERCIVNCYTSGRNDGTPGLHPGHTPYNNLGHWGGTHNGSHPEWFYEKCYPEWKAGGWPEQEAYFNCRYMWSNGEFTPRQTMRGKMALLAYLHAIFNK